MKKTAIPVAPIKKSIILNLKAIETDREPLRGKIINELKEAKSLGDIINTLKKNINSSNSTGTFSMDTLFNTWSRSKLKKALNIELSSLEKYLANEEKRHLRKEVLEEYLKEYKACELKINPVIPYILGAGLESESKLKQNHLDQINECFELILKTAPIHRFETDKVNNILSKTKKELEEEELKGEEKSEYDEELERWKNFLGVRANQFNRLHSFIHDTEPAYAYKQFPIDSSIAREQQLKDIINNMEGEDIGEKRSDCNYIAVKMFETFMTNYSRQQTNLTWIAEKILLLTQSTLNLSDLISATTATNAAPHSFTV